jgi:hypothetical protein
MPGAIRELTARLDELTANLEFVAVSTSLRPRLAGALRWEQGGELIGLAQSFINAKESRAEGLYAAILLRALASFERFARLLVEDAIAQLAKKAHSYYQLSKHIRDRHTALTGRLLATIDEPRDYLTVNYESLIQNLVTCTDGNTSFKLNAIAFVASIISVGPNGLEKALKTVEISDWWDEIGAVKELQSNLGSSGNRNTGKAAGQRLQDLWRMRNIIAHAGDGEGTISDAYARDAIQFLRVFSAALAHVVNARLG